MADNLVASGSPHIHRRVTVSRIMWDVVIALLPALIAGIYFFGVRDTVPVVVACLAGSLGGETVFRGLRKRPPSLGNGSAVITGLILGMSLPPAFSPWLALGAGVVATLVFKELFGGLGKNPFNPAMAARVLLASQYSKEIIVFKPLSAKVLSDSVDVMSSATPLMSMAKLGEGGSWYLPFFLGERMGSIGEASILALLLGAAYLLFRRVIDWRIPVAYLGLSAAISAAIGWDPVYQLLTGALVMTAFFIATDPATSPATKAGKWVFGAGVAVLTMVLRVVPFFPTGEALAVVMMNLTVPFLDRALPPRVYGTKYVRRFQAGGAGEAGGSQVTEAPSR